MYYGSAFDNFMFSVVPFLVIVIFIAVLALIFFGVVSSLAEWDKNNRSPILTVDASVIAKRIDVRHSVGAHNHHSSSTRYYTTFQVESGDRLEFLMSGSEYGLLVEGDQGKLTFQGTRYKNFQRFSH